MINLLAPDDIPECFHPGVWDDIVLDPIPHLTRWVSEGMSLAQIAGHCGVSPGEVLRFTQANKALKAALVEARKEAAWVWDERAEAVLKQAETKDELAKAKELANHYRWRASKLNREQYGEKVDTTVSASLNQFVDKDLANKMIAAVQLAQ